MRNLSKLHCSEKSSLKSNTIDSTKMMKWGSKALQAAGRECTKTQGGGNTNGPLPAVHKARGSMG